MDLRHGELKLTDHTDHSAARPSVADWADMRGGGVSTSEAKGSAQNSSGCLPVSRNHRGTHLNDPLGFAGAGVITACFPGSFV